MSLVIFARNLTAKLSPVQFRLAVTETVLLVEDYARFEGQQTLCGVAADELSLVAPFHGSLLYRKFSGIPLS